MITLHKLDVPRANPPRAIDHFQKLFPNHIVSRVCRLQEIEASREVSNHVFDMRLCPRYKNSLLVELRARREEGEQVAISSPSITDKGVVMDEGKGKATAS